MYIEPRDYTSRKYEALLKSWGFESGSDVHVVDDFFYMKQAIDSLRFDEGIYSFAKFTLNDDDYIATKVETHLQNCSAEELHNRNWYIEAIQHLETHDAKLVRILVPSGNRAFLYRMYYWQQIVPNNPDPDGPLTWR